MIHNGLSFTLRFRSSGINTLTAQNTFTLSQPLRITLDTYFTNSQTEAPQRNNTTKQQHSSRKQANHLGRLTHIEYIHNHSRRQKMHSTRHSIQLSSFHYHIHSTCIHNSPLIQSSLCTLCTDCFLVGGLILRGIDVKTTHVPQVADVMGTFTQLLGQY